MSHSFGLYVNRVRSARKVSIADVARHTGIRESDLAKVESGRICATKDIVLLLADYFEENESELLRLNQVSKITRKTTNLPGNGQVRERQTPFFKNSLKSAKRIDNIERDLALLIERPVAMKFHRPATPLKPFIESITFCKGHNLGHSFERTLPDGSAQLQIVIGEGGRERIGERFEKVERFRRAWLMGMNSAPITYRLSEVQGVIYVRFRPYGLYAFTKIHQTELNNLVVDATLVFGSSIESLWETLATLDDPAQMISCVEDFFTGKLNAVASQPDLLAYMLTHIHLPLTQLAKNAGYSDKYLAKTFQKYIGVGPKVFQRIQRFQAAVRNMTQITESVDWTGLVFEHGYHDQAHFIKEFRYFTGFSPQNYLSMAPSCPRYLHTSDLQQLLAAKI